jgi:hypothetical protein
MALTPDLADVRRPQPRLSLQKVDVEQQRLCEQLVRPKSA